MMLRMLNQVVRHVRGARNNIKDRRNGYILPATILIGLGIAIMSGTFLQYTSLSSQNLNNQSYDSMAQDAADSGIAYANSCVTTGASAWSSLTPGTDCSGVSSGGSVYINQQGTEWRSTFSVAAPTSVGQSLEVVSTGTVQILRGATVVQTYTGTSRTSYSNAITSLPVSAGESITAIKNDQSDCAIANGKLYCWGNNIFGQVGNGTTTSTGTPTLVGGALAGKTVTKVSVAYESVCAIADGTPYCWGNNGNSQLGDNTTTAKLVPTANVPITSSGPLNGKVVTDIGAASQNNPASIIWPFALASPHSCALTADGSVSCWGDGGFRQNTGGGMTTIFFVPTGYYSYPSYSAPTLVMGYSDNTAPLAGTKSIRVGASSHDSCSVSQGKMICWGVQAPIGLWCTSVLFSAAWETLVPFNPCVGSYSNGYDTGAIAGSALAGKFVDDNTWDVSADEGCTMANSDYVCFGTTPAFDLFWAGGYGAPWNAVTPNADVTDSDNGDSIPSWGSAGLYCMINKGQANCSASPFNGYSGTGTSGYQNFQPLITTTGLAGKVPTKIAAGQDHGCVVANGQLLCWGYGGGGVLADGNTGIHITNTATVTASGVIGTTNGTTAASGPISVGGGHACGVANGTLFCWGKNTNGQLGTGNTSDLSQPRAPSGIANRVVTKVSAGTSHTCAITDGTLYCWGLNSNGQLGLGNTTSYTSPQLVGGSLAGKRVTDVSAGATGTCAIANGQAYCWGLNTNQQVGDGTTTQQTSPTQATGAAGVLTGKSITSISMGTSHACAVANADLYCWGNNANGRTGLNTTVGNANPTLVSGGTAGSPTGPNSTRPSVSMVSAGDDFTCAIINAKVSCWGDNANGRTGLNTAVGNQLIPAVLSGTAGTYYATSISAGTTHACGVINGNSSQTNGNLYCWGDMTNGRVGNGGSSGNQLAATLINGGSVSGKSTTNVAVGSSSSCSVSNADILCWGAAANGRMGDVDVVTDNLTPNVTASYQILSGYLKGPIF